MILEVIGILLLVILVAITINAIEDIRKKNDSKISFRESMDLTELPVVTFYNGDKKLNFLLDTGSNVSHINSSVIHLLDHTKTDQKTDTIGMEGNKVSNDICKMAVYYRNQRFEEDFIISDLNDAFDIIKQEDGVQIHGILGSKFFEKYRYILDFGELIAYIK
jgi:predicted aspartyl protease